MSNQEHSLFIDPSYQFLFNRDKNRLRRAAAADVDQGWHIDETRRMSLLKWRMLILLFLVMAAAAAYFSIAIDKRVSDRPISVNVQVK